MRGRGYSCEGDDGAGEVATGQGGTEDPVACCSGAAEPGGDPVGADGVTVSVPLAPWSGAWQTTAGAEANRCRACRSRGARGSV